MRSQFYKLWLATTTSHFGEGLGLTALPLLAANLTREPVLISGLTLALTMPWFLCSLVVGVFTDRADRKRLLVVSSIVRAVLMLALGLAVYFGQAYLVLLYVIAALLGITDVVFDSVSQAILKNVVPPDELETANSRIYLTTLLGNQLIGRAMGSALFSVVAYLPFLLHGALLTCMAALVSSLKGNFRPARQASTSAPLTALHVESMEGIRWLMGHRLFLATTIVAGIENLLGTACFSILVLYALDVLQLNEAGYGLLLGSGAIGGLIGSLVVRRTSRRFGAGSTMFIAILLEGISYAGMTVPNVYVVGAMLSLHAFSNVLWGVVILSLRQALIPDQLLGRVNSIVRLISWGVIPIGAALGGLLGSVFGLVTPFWLAGAVVILLGFVVLPHINNRTVQLARERA